MGSNQAQGEKNGKSRWITKPSSYLFILFFSFFISMAGGFVLVWWLLKYHPSNRQLWMVPFGFLLFLTPLIICLSAILPKTRTRIDQDQAFKTPTTATATATATDPLSEANR